MAFPGARIELQIGGTWTNITSDVYLRNRLTILRGRADEGYRVDPAACSLTINNKGGKYSPKNPLSPYFGLIGRNTPIRVAAHAGTQRLVVPDTAGARATTPDTAALDIVGDIDIRVDARLDNWGTNLLEIIAKQELIGDQRSWRLVQLGDGVLEFIWFTAGTAASGVTARSTVALPIQPGGRISIRITLDVDNGSGGWTVRFFTAQALTGPWVQLGDTITGAGVTSIYNSTSPLDVGDVAGMALSRPIGEYYKVEVRNGIDGVLVASPDFSVQPVGTTSFTDSAGRVWSIQGGAEITDRRVRLAGEMSSWPTRWDVSGKDVWVAAEAAGPLRRLGQGAKPLASTLRRRIPSGSPLAYWPMEEGSTATQAYSPIAGVQPLKVNGFSLAADDSLAGSSALPAVRGGAILSGSVPAPAVTTNEWHTEFIYFLQAGPATARTVLQWLGTGTVKRWQLQLDSGGARVYGYDDDGNVVTSVTPSLIGLGTFNAWTRWKLFARQNGANVDWTLVWVPIGGIGAALTTSFAGSVGRISGVSGPSSYHSDLDGLLLGHLAVFSTADTQIYNDADHGFRGESVDARMVRLTTEEGVPLQRRLGPQGTPQMGPQRPATLLDLLQEAADVDGGVLSEQRDMLALRYRSRDTLHNQVPALTLDYTAPGEVAPPLEPVDDDQRTRNDITVQRTGGSSARAVLEAGPLSVQAPPAGIGRYDESVALNLYDDDQPADVAGWRLHLGTWDEARYPRLHVNLAAAPHLVDAVTAVEVGDRIRIINPPPWLPPDPIDLLVEGYTETIGVYEWDIVFTCSPAGPWTVGVLDDAELGRADTDGSELAAAATATDTELIVHTPQDVDDRATWVNSAGPSSPLPAEFPFDVRLGGEVVSVTGIQPMAWDTFTRTVSNGWGSSSSGHAWATSGGSSSDRSVNGSEGLVTLASSPGNLRAQTLLSDVADCDIKARMSVDQLATGAAFLPAILARYQSISSCYRVRLHLETTGAVNLALTLGTTQIGATASTGLTYAAGTKLWLHARLIGDRALARVWEDGDIEPAGWMLDQTVTSGQIATGAVGLSGSAFTGNTNINPALSFDQFEVVTPQRFTVVRSENGISKAQALGTDVRLAQPAILAL